MPLYAFSSSNSLTVSFIVTNNHYSGSEVVGYIAGAPGTYSLSGTDSLTANATVSLRGSTTATNDPKDRLAIGYTGNGTTRITYLGDASLDGKIYADTTMP